MRSVSTRTSLSLVIRSNIVSNDCCVVVAHRSLKYSAHFSRLSFSCTLSGVLSIGPRGCIPIVVLCDRLTMARIRIMICFMYMPSLLQLAFVLELVDQVFDATLFIKLVIIFKYKIGYVSSV